MHACECVWVHTATCMWKSRGGSWKRRVCFLHSLCGSQVSNSGHQAAASLPTEPPHHSLMPFLPRFSLNMGKALWRFSHLHFLLLLLMTACTWVWWRGQRSDSISFFVSNQLICVLVCFSAVLWCTCWGWLAMACKNWFGGFFTNLCLSISCWHLDILYTVTQDKPCSVPVQWASESKQHISTYLLTEFHRHGHLYYLRVFVTCPGKRWEKRKRKC